MIIDPALADVDPLRAALRTDIRARGRRHEPIPGHGGAAEVAWAAVRWPVPSIYPAELTP